MNRTQLRNHLKSQHKYYRVHHKRCIRIAQRCNTTWYLRHRASFNELNRFKNIINLRLDKLKE